MKLSDKADLIEEVGMTIYTDSFTQYGTCSADKWKATSETQREFCRGQARAALEKIEQFINDAKSLHDLRDEMRAVARGDRPAPFRKDAG